MCACVSVYACIYQNLYIPPPSQISFKLSTVSWVVINCDFIENLDVIGDSGVLLLKEGQSRVLFY